MGLYLIENDRFRCEGCIIGFEFLLVGNQWFGCSRCLDGVDFETSFIGERINISFEY